MDTETKFIVGFIIGLFSIAPAKWVISSHQEAAAYNKITGANVSTWEAMWIELRVQGESSKEGK